MVVSRTRSEYRLVRASDALTSAGSAASPSSVRPVELADREPLASLLLDAYRGTVDDEGEGDDEARGGDRRVLRSDRVATFRGARRGRTARRDVVGRDRRRSPLHRSGRHECGVQRAGLRANRSPCLTSFIGRRWRRGGRGCHHRWQRALRATVRRPRIRASRKLGRDLVLLNDGAPMAANAKAIARVCIARAADTRLLTRSLTSVWLRR